MGLLSLFPAQKVNNIFYVASLCFSFLVLNSLEKCKQNFLIETIFFKGMRITDNRNTFGEKNKKKVIDM